MKLYYFTCIDDYLFDILDLSNVPDVTIGTLKRSSTDDALDQVQCRPRSDQTYKVRSNSYLKWEVNLGSYRLISTHFLHLMFVSVSDLNAAFVYVSDHVGILGGMRTLSHA